MQADSTQAAHELGDASFYLHDYHFRQDNHNGICTVQAVAAMTMLAARACVVLYNKS